MKLDRLNPASAKAAAAERVPAPQAPAVKQVESAEALSPERRHSLLDDLEEVEAQALGPFEGRDLIQQQAHAVAEELSHLGAGATRLVRTNSAALPWHVVDDEV